MSWSALCADDMEAGLNRNILSRTGSEVTMIPEGPKKTT